MRSDAELIRSADGGDAEAWKELVERHSPLIVANARAVGADHVLAQDVMQLVWIQVLNRLGTLREPDKLRGWLSIIARNAARNELRKKKPTSDLDSLFELADDSPPVDTRLARRTERSAVAAALAQLSERCRELLTLLFGAEMSYEEICEVTGMAIGSIGPTRQRCLNSLRTHLPDEVVGA
ncbi:MAG: RNA polymerase sigma factor [Ilumatobacter sp.]